MQAQKFLNLYKRDHLTNVSLTNVDPETNRLKLISRIKNRAETA